MWFCGFWDEDLCFFCDNEGHGFLGVCRSGFNNRSVFDKVFVCRFLVKIGYLCVCVCVCVFR